MSTYLKPAFIMLLLLTLLTGVIYPALVTAIAQVFFADQANGSLLKDQQGHPIGSSLVGQSFSDPKYFWGRPSATGPYPYNAAASSGSNFGPTNPALVAAVTARIQALKSSDPSNKAAIPVDLVTASGSGLDPHISPAAAEYQIDRVAKIRQLSSQQVRDLVVNMTQARQWHVFGEPKINVLLLNKELDEIR
ncbi:MAG: potassium-transporting ATPase subunit KdpC [Methylococcaceae bacterium]|nr:potassium-transporting ATPase subunit KdpC [Methylococcaceae bacterium]MDZ4155765.1 potassium-transporting ATPase subunit KdpC [Methylococcales bacterium]MDP2391886.1 potassium-transporting ATPase subunit KdpC [Methylococcaceae bacterium]MDP3018875.1 potassium-transporting ATPase subunit KdpC [Methylococcaceae bacterium]MDP3391436.1 potassium-transporting ATPase subunit KdpC [Methylococcaceae bacterium]